MSPSVKCQGYPRAESCSTANNAEVEMVQEKMTDMVPKDGETRSALDAGTSSQDKYSNGSSRCEDTQSPDGYPLFEKFCNSGLCRLGLKPLEEIDFLEIWIEAKPFSELVGPYWSLRAALGPVVETLLLLDRLLYLQEQGNSVEAVVLPLFNPILSPRNVAIIAQKK